LLALALLVRPALATFAYQRALQSSARSAALLERATSLDPALPLYRLHRALGLAARQPGSTLAAREAVAASRAAVGLAPLWLAAGLLARDAGEASAAGALLEACALDPLGALAPFALMAETADAELAAARGGRAILADPVLAAAVHWDEHPLQFAEAVSRVATWPGLSADWQSELVARLERLERRRRRGEAAAAERVVWSLEVDGRPATALALHAFRRTPWPFELGAVELDARVAATLAAVPAAGALPATDPAAFPERLCAGPPDLSGRP
jgi:hypothetical protein